MGIIENCHPTRGGIFLIPGRYARMDLRGIKKKDLSYEYIWNTSVGCG